MALEMEIGFNPGSWTCEQFSGGREVVTLTVRSRTTRHHLDHHAQQALHLRTKVVLPHDSSGTTNLLVRSNSGFHLTRRHSSSQRQVEKAQRHATSCTIAPAEPVSEDPTYQSFSLHGPSSQALWWVDDTARWWSARARRAAARTEPRCVVACGQRRSSTSWSSLSSCTAVLDVPARHRGNVRSRIRPGVLRQFSWSHRCTRYRRWCF